MTRKLVVKNDGPDPMTVEVIAESIKAIAAGFRKMQSGPLTMKGLVVLIQHACPAGSMGRRIGFVEIRAVLEGIDALERTYLKPKKNGHK